jgi:hypothetical protein
METAFIEALCSHTWYLSSIFVVLFLTKYVYKCIHNLSVLWLASRNISWRHKIELRLSASKKTLSSATRHFKVLGTLNLLMRTSSL